MRVRVRLLALGVGLLVSRPAFAAQQGILAGLELTYQVPGAGLNSGYNLSIGNAFIQGVLVQLAANEAGTAVANPMPLDVATAWNPMMPYYCYVANTGNDPNFMPAGYSFLCASTPPRCDGTPTSQIQAPGGALTLAGIFVGSVVTAPITGGAGFGIIPFYRNGDEVVFVYPSSHNAGGLVNHFEPGVWLQEHFYFGGAGALNWNTPAVWPCPSGSASACLFDVQYVNHSTFKTSTAYMLDPAANTIVAAGANFTLAAQAQMISSNSFAQAANQSYRARLNTDRANTNSLWTGVDDGSSPDITYVVRGYVESIDSLCSR